MGGPPLLETRLFHAIVLMGAALGAAACTLTGECVTESDASSDARADANEPCAINAPPNPILSGDAAGSDALGADEPDVQAWPPTKC